MSRTAAGTAEAADALDAWLLTQPRQAPASIPPAIHDARPSDAQSNPANAALPTSAAPPAPLRNEIAAPLTLPSTDWLHHHLTISGPVLEVAAFQKQAAGGGMIPWHLDLDRMEEGWFHLLVAPPALQERSLSVAGARILAVELREAVGRHHQLAVSQAAGAKSCPFDLHALLPVPGDLLRRGPDDPAALAWLWEHWGTTQALRHVALHPGSTVSGRPDAAFNDQAALRLSFWSADWTPWRAFAALRGRFPALLFDVRPTYGAAG